MKPNIPFCKFMPVFFAFSMLLVVLAAGHIGYRFLNGTMNVGIDFAGGLELRVAFRDMVAITELRRAFADEKEEIGIQAALGKGGGSTFLLRMRGGRADVDVYEPIIAKLRKTFGADRFEIQEKTVISGAMSRDNLVKGVLLVLVSWVLVLIYTTLRFEFKFAVSAVTAVLHDVIITMGFVSVFDKEWNILVLTAILTLIGYSINDTIVIFDRIRENTALKLYKNFRDLLDVSFNQTLSRTLATGGAVLLALLAIMFVGGQVINAFAFVLFIGMIAGTYSSIFVASSLVLMWTEAAERSKRKKELRATPAAG